MLFNNRLLAVGLALFVGLLASPAWATITQVQATTSATTSIALNGVATGNTLVLTVSFYRATSTGAACPTPTDSNGTVSVAQAPTPATIGTHDVGIAIFYMPNAMAGTHTFTIASFTTSHATLQEFSPVTATAFDVANNAKTNASIHTSQVTGTTASTAQANELVVIGNTLAATTGAADVGWTDPVTGFTTSQKAINDATDLAVLHAWKTVSAIGTQSATFNWTNNDSTNTSAAAVATFKQASPSSHNLLLMGVGQ